MHIDDRAEQQPDQAGASAANAAPDPTTVDTLAYPISPDYVKSWTPVRALCELIANALDEDPTPPSGGTTAC